MSRKKKVRVIDFLRRTLPLDRWTYNSQLGHWESDGGAYAYWEARFAPKFDGDDDTFESYLRIKLPNHELCFSKWEVYNNTMLIKRNLVKTWCNI